MGPAVNGPAAACSIRQPALFRNLAASGLEPKWQRAHMIPSFSKSALASHLLILKIMLDTQTRPGRAHTTYIY